MVAPLYIAEIAPPAVRGRLSSTGSGASGSCSWVRSASRRALLALVYLPETKGVSLEQIQRRLGIE